MKVRMPEVKHRASIVLAVLVLALLTAPTADAQGVAFAVIDGPYSTPNSTGWISKPAS